VTSKNSSDQENTLQRYSHLINNANLKGIDLSKILGEESGFGKLVPRKETNEEPPIAATSPITKSQNSDSTTL
jgi:hypothetical protein